MSRLWAFYNHVHVAYDLVGTEYGHHVDSFLRAERSWIELGQKLDAVLLEGVREEINSALSHCANDPWLYLGYGYKELGQLKRMIDYEQTTTRPAGTAMKARIDDVDLR